MKQHAVGSLVKARGREWVVLPNSTEQMLLVRPLGGTFDEATGIHTALEDVTSAEFALPDPNQIGDYRSGRLLRDAVRLGFRASAGPFRSFARIAVEPRPYQLVPLLMALKLDPIRLLIADDVGIGKTVEASLIAREMLDRGEIRRLAVLCPPQLAEQWQAELANKFYIDAELVLPSTVTRLERICRMGQSLFEHPNYPYVVVSTDFIKSDRRRAEFLRTCPEFVIVDEAHTAAPAMGERGGRHQRYDLVAGLSEDPTRHMLLVTATPHSGKEGAFRALLGILNPTFDDLPDDLTGEENKEHRRELARYFVQRRRADIRAYMDAETKFPDRQPSEANYTLTEDYRRLFNRVLDYARETVTDPAQQGHRQRVKWWSALALLRSLASSPAAAAATLRARAATLDAPSEDDVNEIGQRTVLDLLEDEAAEGIDVTPGADTAEDDSTTNRLRNMAKAADTLRGEGDAKLQTIIPIVAKLVKEGYHPILFCRFIPTVKYLVDELSKRKEFKGVIVDGITGELPPSDREARVRELSQADKRILICTDCLSEGINLQDGFSAVIHYDLSWNPTRHEQREGRVDRYGQESKTVRTLTYYGLDNKIDGIVLDVLLRKHQTIRDSLGVSVPVPVDTAQIVEAIFEGLLLREDAHAGIQQTLPGFEEHIRPVKEKLFREWEASAQREGKLSQTMFAQRPIKVEEVAAELNAAREAVGSGVDVREFMIDAAQMYRGFVTANGSVSFDLRESPTPLKEAVGVNNLQFTARFEQPLKDGEIHLTRTHPIVEGMATYVMDTALDTEAHEAHDEHRARRCGAFRTSMVSKRTTLLLMRFRYHITSMGNDGEERTMLAEDVQVIGFESAPGQHTWIDNEQAEALMLAQPDANMATEQAQQFVRGIVDNYVLLEEDLNKYAHNRAADLLEAHQRVRIDSRGRGRTKVEPQTPPDVLGIYVYLPAGR